MYDTLLLGLAETNSSYCMARFEPLVVFDCLHEAVRGLHQKPVGPGDNPPTETGLA